MWTTACPGGVATTPKQEMPSLTASWEPTGCSTRLYWISWSAVKLGHYVVLSAASGKAPSDRLSSSHSGSTLVTLRQHPLKNACDVVSNRCGSIKRSALLVARRPGSGRQQCGHSDTIRQPDLSKSADDRRGSTGTEVGARPAFSSLAWLFADHFNSFGCC